jgi:hypothetical protein
MHGDSTIFPSGMPTWMAIYLSVYVCFSVWSFIDDWTKRKFSLMLFIEAAGVFSLVLAATSHWSSSIRDLLSGWIGIIYFVGLLALIFFVSKRVSSTISDFEISLNEKIWSAVSGGVFLVLVNLPLIWFGGKALYL